jgi:hypothetical protein
MWVKRATHHIAILLKNRTGVSGVFVQLLLSKNARNKAGFF